MARRDGDRRRAWPRARGPLGSITAALVLATQAPAQAAPSDPDPRPVNADPPERPAEGQRARASPVRVVLVQPVGADPVMAEALVRIQGELVAEGFTVMIADSPAAVPAEAAIAQGSARSIELSLDADAHVADLVVVDRLTNRKLTRRIDMSGLPPDRLTEVLAVRTVELLRASLAELSLPAAPPPAAPRPAAEPREPRFGVEAGTSVLLSPGGHVDPAVLSFVRLRFAPIQRLELRLAFAGLGTSPRVPGPDRSSARVTQLLGLVEVALRPWAELRARPSFSLGAGALHVAVEGEARQPYQGIESASWSAVFGGSVGVEVLLGPRVGMAMEMHAFAAIPYPTVRFLGEEAARVARPGLLASVTLVGWL